MLVSKVEISMGYVLIGNTLKNNYRERKVQYYSIPCFVCADVRFMPTSLSFLFGGSG